MTASQLSDAVSARQCEVDALKSGPLNLTQIAFAYIAIVAFMDMTGYIPAHRHNRGGRKLYYRQRHPYGRRYGEGYLRLLLWSR